MGSEEEGDDSGGISLQPNPAFEPEDSPLNKQNALHILRRADTAKKQELLFATWDTDRDGYVDFSDFKEGLQKLRPTSEEIHLEFVAEAALKALPALPPPNNQRLDSEEFKAFVEKLTRQMGQPMSIVSEHLILCGLEIQPTTQAGSALVRKIQESNRASQLQKQRMKDLSQEPRIVHLFQHFNASGSGSLSFSELCHLLWTIRQDVSLRQSRAEAVDTMLLLDAESERSVNVVEFARFMYKLARLLHMNACELADTMLQISSSARTHSISPEDKAIKSSLESKDFISQVYETLADRKMHLLFELWDKDGDGHISFAELALGLRKLSPSTEPLTETASDAAEAMLVFDANSDQNLNRAEFAHFVNAFCKGCEADFNTLSEFLILLAAMEDSPSEELAFLLAKDKVDRAIAGLDASWRSGRVESKSGSPSQPPRQAGGEVSADLSRRSQQRDSQGGQGSLEGIGQDLSHGVATLRIDDEDKQ